MSSEGLPPNFAEVVRPRFEDCDGIVVAASGECLKIQAQEEDIPGREFKGLRPGDLDDLELQGSWLVGILLCPGDHTKAIAAWASTLGPSNVDRVRFYYLPNVDLGDAFEAWYETGLLDPLTAEVEDWPSFHQTFGRDHSNQVYEDALSYPEWFED